MSETLQNLPMSWRWVDPVTLLTPPPVTFLYNLLVAPLGWTSRITESLMLDKVDRRLGGKVFHLVRSPDVLVLDLTDGLNFVGSDGRSPTTRTGAHAAVRVGIVLHAVSFRIEPMCHDD